MSPVYRYQWVKEILIVPFFPRQQIHGGSTKPDTALLGYGVFGGTSHQVENAVDNVETILGGTDACTHCGSWQRTAGE